MIQIAAVTEVKELEPVVEHAVHQPGRDPHHPYRASDGIVLFAETLQGVRELRVTDQPDLERQLDELFEAGQIGDDEAERLTEEYEQFEDTDALAATGTDFAADPEAQPEPEPEPEIPPNPIYFRVNSTELAKELTLAGKVCEKGNKIPVLRMVLIKATPTGVTLRTTDLDRHFVTPLPSAEVLQEGAVAVDLARLLKLATKFKKGSTVVFQQDANAAETGWLTVTSGKFKAQITNTQEKHFPPLVAVPEFKHWIQVGELNRMIGQVRFCITSEESRYALNGALLVSKEDGLIRMVASDGHRLGLSETIAGSVATPEKGWIVPNNALSFIELLSKEKGLDQTGVIQIAEREDRELLGFRIGERTLYTRLLAGQFPNYELVMPKDCEKHFRFNPTDLAEAIGRLAAIGVIDSRSNGVSIFLEQNELRVGAEQSDVGKATDSIPCLTNAPGFSVGFSSTYMLEFFRQLDKDQDVVVDAKDEQSPMLLRPAETDRSMARLGQASTFDAAKGFSYVLMPMRLVDSSVALDDSARGRRHFALYESPEDAVDAYLDAVAAGKTLDHRGHQSVPTDVFRITLEEAGHADLIAAREADRAWKAEDVPVVESEEIEDIELTPLNDDIPLDDDIQQIA